MSTSAPNPSAILQTAFSFWSSKVLLTAVELGVFTRLANRQLTGTELGAELKLHPRAIADFFDALVAMKFLNREGDGPQSKYFNTPEGALFLDKNSPRYVGGILVMLNARLFKFWHDLPEALRTGKPQNEIKHGQKGMFEELYEELPRLEQFMGAMTGLSRINFEAFADKFDFSRFKTLCDIGGATGLLCLEVAKRHPQLKCTSFDLPPVEPIAKKHIAATGLSSRVGTATGTRQRKLTYGGEFSRYFDGEAAFSPVGARPPHADHLPNAVPERDQNQNAFQQAKPGGE